MYSSRPQHQQQLERRRRRWCWRWQRECASVGGEAQQVAAGGEGARGPLPATGTARQHVGQSATAGTRTSAQSAQHAGYCAGE